MNTFDDTLTGKLTWPERKMIITVVVCAMFLAAASVSLTFYLLQSLFPIDNPLPVFLRAGISTLAGAVICFYFYTRQTAKVRAENTELKDGQSQ